MLLNSNFHAYLTPKQCVEFSMMNNWLHNVLFNHICENATFIGFPETNPPHYIAKKKIFVWFDDIQRFSKRLVQHDEFNGFSEFVKALKQETQRISFFKNCLGPIDLPPESIFHILLGALQSQQVISMFKYASQRPCFRSFQDNWRSTIT